MRCQLTALAFLTATAAAIPAQAVSAADSALVLRILTAEDRRDSTAKALSDGAASKNPRVRLIANRAIGRIKDPKFAARDSLPPVAAPPKYGDPDWRLRYRALSARSTCGELGTAFGNDSVWAVRFRAVDLLPATCTSGMNVLRGWWVDLPQVNGARAPHATGWQLAGHGIVALARLAPIDARTRLPRFAENKIVGLRMYAARAAAVLSDTATLRDLATDANDNVREVAIDALAKVAGHSSDDVYARALIDGGYQTVRAAARALKGAPEFGAFQQALIALDRMRRDSSETSRDARLAVLDLVAERGQSTNYGAFARFATDFDCEVARKAAQVAHVPAHCTPLSPVPVPREAVALALGKQVTLRVTLADSSGGGHFDVRLRGDVAPIMASRVLALVRAGWYNNRTWYRVEPDFVIQGGGPGSNEYVGHPRFMRDELSSLPQLRGTVGMSTRGHDTGDAQWFVNLRDNQRLTRDYTAFGEVVDGIDVVDGVLEGDVIAKMEVIAPTPAPTSAPRRSPATFRRD